MSGQQHACVGILLTAVCAISSVGSSAQPHCCCCQQRAPLQDGCAEVLLLPPRCRLAVEKRVGTMLELLQDEARPRQKPKMEVLLVKSPEVGRAAGARNSSSCHQPVLSLPCSLPQVLRMRPVTQLLQTAPALSSAV